MLTICFSSLVMFSKRLIILVSLLATFSRLCGASQLCLDRKARNYFNSDDAKVQRRVKSNVYIILIVFLLSTATVLVKMKDSDTVDYNICLVLWFLFILLYTTLLVWYFHSTEMAAIANGMLQYAFQLNRKFKKFKGKVLIIKAFVFLGTFLPDFDADTDTLSMKLDFLVALCCCLPFMAYPLLHACFAFSRSGVLFLHLITPFTENFLLVRILAYTIHFYVATVIVHSGALTIVLAITYLFYMTNIFTKELRMGCFKYRALQSLRRAENVSRVYREFQVLHTRVINLWGPIILFAHFICTVVPVYGTVLVLCNREKANSFVLLFLSLIFGGIWGVWMMTLEFGKHLYVHGQEVFLSWKRHTWESKEKARYMSKFRKSCRPLLLSYHETFAVRRVTPFVYNKSVFRGIFGALLTLT